MNYQNYINRYKKKLQNTLLTYRFEEMVMDSSDCIPIKEVLNEAKKKWIRN
jgi:hypothetical protein